MRKMGEDPAAGHLQAAQAELAKYCEGNEQLASLLRVVFSAIPATKRAAAAQQAPPAAAAKAPAPSSAAGAGAATDAKAPGAPAGAAAGVPTGAKAGEEAPPGEQ